MTTWGASLHKDVQNINTSAGYGDPGDGSSNWFEITKTLDGGDVTQGLKADAAVTDPTVSATLMAVLKGILTANRLSAAGMLKAEDAAHASGDSGIMSLGVRNDARAALAGTTLDYSPVSVGDAGNMFTTPAPSSLSGWSPTVYQAVAATSGVIKASAGKLYGGVFVNNNAAIRYLQLFNTAAVPADAAVPYVSIPVPLTGQIQLDFQHFGIYFSTGICWCLSTTFGTKTLAAADGSALLNYL